MRLIDADLLTSTLKNSLDKAISNGDILQDGDEFRVLTKFFEMIDAVPTVEAESVKQEWISVKDRLPEKGKGVLVYWDDGFDIGSYVGGEVEGDVYWMPLPEPPKE